MKDLRRSAWNSASESVELAGCEAGVVGPRAGDSGAGFGGFDRRSGAAAGTPFWESALRTTSMTCLGVQLALERHLVAPAFQASWTMLVR